MNLGFDKLRQHLPELNSLPAAIVLFLPAAILVSLVSFVFSRISVPEQGLLANLVFIVLGFALFSSFFWVRRNFKSRFGDRSYRFAFGYLGFPGVATLFTVVAHVSSTTGPEFSSGAWGPAFWIVGWFLIAEGALLFIRTVRIFGIDYLVALYIYFPEESHLVQHHIYNLLRHPAYAAAIRIAMGSALLAANWYAVLTAFVFASLLWTMVIQVEERELAERFGDSYLLYLRNVPAFWPRTGNLLTYYKFLLLGR